MTDKSLSVDNEPHELKLGRSFDSKSGVAYHSIRYDFKPASVDTSQEAQVEIGQGHHVTLTVPHVEGSGKTHTVYKGNKRPVSKECVLIIDHDTGTFTLERLNNNINVKKTRMESSSKVSSSGRPLTPVESRLKNSPNKVKSSHTSIPHSKPQSPPVTPQESSSTFLGEISDSSSDSGSSDSDSDAESSNVQQGVPPVPMTALQTTAPSKPNKPPGLMSMITADLQLSDSDSDSD